MIPICQLIGVFLYCGNSAQPTAQFLQPRTIDPSIAYYHALGSSAASTTRFDDIRKQLDDKQRVEEMVAAHLRAERMRKR